MQRIARTGQVPLDVSGEGLHAGIGRKGTGKDQPQQRDGREEPDS